MLITNGTIVTPGIRRRTIQRQVNLGPISLRFVTVIIVAAAALIALAQSTQSATKSYKEQELKQIVSEKQKEVEEMQFESTRLQSLQAITNSQPSPEISPTPKLEESKKIDFLPASGNTHISQLQLTAESEVE
jgi:hypothetical protein